MYLQKFELVEKRFPNSKDVACFCHARRTLDRDLGLYYDKRPGRTTNVILPKRVHALRATGTRTTSKSTLTHAQQFKSVDVLKSTEAASKKKKI